MTKLNMKDQTIGVEIEMTGITRKQAAQVVREHLGGYIEAAGNSYHITAPDNRTWTVKYDGSINAHYRTAPGQKIQPGGGHEWAAELTTPVLSYDDIPTLQELVRKLHKAGARSSAALGCGIHIHVGAEKHDARSLRNLVNLVTSKQTMLYEALQVEHGRENGYARKNSDALTAIMNTNKPKTLNQINQILDGTSTDRYHGLNLRAIWKIGTIEWRLFNGTMHAGEIKAYIQLALAISAQAINQRSASPTVTTSDNPAFTFRTWLIRLGLNGDEYKTCREHLLKHLPGNKAWRHARAA